MTEADRLRIDILDRESDPETLQRRPIFEEEDTEAAAGVMSDTTGSGNGDAADRPLFRVPN